MLHLWKAIFLGFVQGMAEFLPISSSGHLVLFEKLLHFHQQGIAFEVFVHFGTLLSIFVVFRKELLWMLQAPYKVWVEKSTAPEYLKYLRWDLYIIVATIPAGFVGLFLKDYAERLFSDILVVLIALLFTAFIMIVTQFLSYRKKEFNYGNTFIIGIAQAIAIIPGVSRSGSTIFTGMAFGLERQEVAKFSFLMSIPAILGAVVLQVGDLMRTPPTSTEMIDLTAGTIAAFFFGYLAIKWLLEVVKKGKLQWFGYYCAAVAISGLIFYFWV